MTEQEARHLALGQWGEARAAAYLEEQGWEILARNWRWGRGEVDLIVGREEPGYGEGEVRRVVAFVEVKTRFASRARNAPKASVTYRKRRQVASLASAWLKLDPARRGVSVRFDVIGVLRGRRDEAIIEHIQGAFDAEGRTR